MIKDFIKSQKNQLLLAIVQQGYFSSKNEHKHFEVPLDKWSRWTPEQRQRHILKIQHGHLVQVNADDDTDTISLMEASSSTVLSNAILGVCFEDCGITDTANSILQINNTGYGCLLCLFSTLPMYCFISFFSGSFRRFVVYCRCQRIASFPRYSPGNK
jgi:hypothetical protein